MLLGLSCYAQQKTTEQNQQENFYTVRKKILKELNEAKENGDINETEGEDDDAWQNLSVGKILWSHVFFQQQIAIPAMSMQ